MMADQGEEFELRVARVEFAEGAHVRLRVPVRMDVESGRDILTDIDVLGLEVDQRLRTTRTVIECKSGKGQSGEPDRLFWLAGFRQYLEADRATLARVTTSSRGLRLARQLQLQVLDMEVLEQREAANAWVPERFAHVGGNGCIAAEERTDTQLKGLPTISADLATFLRHETSLAKPHRILSALGPLRSGVERQGVIPQPTRSVLAGHAFLGLLVAALQHAADLDTLRLADLGVRLKRAMATGNPDDDHVLEVLGRADALMEHSFERIHEQYTKESGSARKEVALPRLRDLVEGTPDWLDVYLDLVERLRANPSVAHSTLQTAELVCFDALMGDSAWEAEAFDHLFTAEHQQLLLIALRVFRASGGDQLADCLGKIAKLSFDRVAPAAPDRRIAATADSIGASTLQAPENAELPFQENEGNQSAANSQ